jgi:hypothetical protein
LIERLSPSGTLAEGLVAPNLILPLVLFNLRAFPMSLAKIVFQHTVHRNCQHFLIRALFLAEVSQRSLAMMFEAGTTSARPLFILFCAWAMDWSVDLLKRLAAKQGMDPISFLKTLVRACERLPPESLYILRVVLIMALFTIGDVRSVLELFLRLLQHVFRVVIKSRELPQNGTVTMISQLVILASQQDQLGNEPLVIFTRLLERLLKCVPDIEVSAEVNLEPVQVFINQNEVNVSAGIRAYMDQRPQDHILIYSFAQNFRFMVNMQNVDRTAWIPVS